MFFSFLIVFNRFGFGLKKAKHFVEGMETPTPFGAIAFLENGMSSVSDTAEYGAYTRGSRIVTPETKAEMKKILGEVQRGDFAREWLLENQVGQPHFKALRRITAEHPIEVVGSEVRSMMAWLNK